MANFSPTPVYSERFIDALAQVAEWHQYQIRKQNNIPYVSHLMSVAALVMESGGDEDEAIAALAHDAVEDIEIPIEDIRQFYGDRVAHIVSALSENKALPKEQRKVEYVRSVDNGGRSVALVSCADKLHNLRCYLQNPELIKPDVVAFYCQLFPIYKSWLDEDKNLVPEHLLVKEMWELIECKLLPMYSAYLAGDEDDSILIVMSDRGLISSSLRVASSQDLIDKACSRNWNELPDKLNLANGTFDKLELIAKQNAEFEALGVEREDFSWAS